jgi:transposase-like protein
MPCPRCNSEVVMKDGTTQLGGQRFRCSRCARRFTRRSISAFSRRAFPDDVIALAIRWYVRYRLSYAEVSEWLAERGILVDQSTIYRWVQRFLPLFGQAARKYRQPVGLDWRVDETYARIRGRWHYIYRAVDGCGQIVDAYISPTRDMVAARTFFEQAIASTRTTPVGSSPTRPPAIDQLSPRLCLASDIGPGAIAPMASSVTTDFSRNGCGQCAASSPSLQQRFSCGVTR